jgi:hypothetical protein
MNLKHDFLISLYLILILLYSLLGYGIPVTIDVISVERSKVALKIHLLLKSLKNSIFRLIINIITSEPKTRFSYVTLPKLLGHREVNSPLVHCGWLKL